MRKFAADKKLFKTAIIPSLPSFLLRGHTRFGDWAIEWQMNDNLGNNAHREKKTT